MATYPTSPELPHGDDDTELSPANWNTFIDNVNAIGADLVAARGDGQTFPGTPNTAGQSSTIEDALDAVRCLLSQISGETNWYDAPDGSLSAHNHSVGQGGLIPWGSLGESADRKVEIHPFFPGGLLTTSLRGSAASGNNTITITNGQDVVSDVAHSYYNGISSEASLNDYYVAVRFTLPLNFTAWATANAIQIGYRTASVNSADCHVDVYVYKSGTGGIIASSENNVNVNWSNIGISGSSLVAGPTTWVAGDIVELYIKLESKNSNYARIGKIAFNYTS